MEKKINFIVIVFITVIFFLIFLSFFSQVRMAGERGSGAGKGGGGGGAIREAGGSFGKMEAAHEDQYFYNMVNLLRKNQLINLIINLKIHVLIIKYL